MTSEQIANMREAAGYGVWAGEVMRLLDEREALLEAAFDALLSWQTTGTIDAKALGEVIVKAESP